MMMMMVVVINIMKAFLVLFEFVTREACKGQGCSGRFGLVTARRKYLFVVYLVTIRAKGSSSARSEMMPLKRLGGGEDLINQWGQVIFGKKI